MCAAPPLKLKQSGWAGNYALGSSYIALPWWAGQVRLPPVLPLSCTRQLAVPLPLRLASAGNASSCHPLRCACCGCNCFQQRWATASPSHLPDARSVSSAISTPPPPQALFGTLTLDVCVLTILYSIAGLGIAIVNDFKSIEGVI